MKVIDIIEARMTSTRLPGKVMMPFMGRPSLELMIERIKRASFLDQIVVATTINQTDDVIVDLCRKLHIQSHRGGEEDVLKRVVKAGKKFSADVIVRTTSDCPLVDWRFVDHLVKIYMSKKYDYASNIVERSFPIGLDVEVFSLKKLAEIEKTVVEKIYREHPPYYFYVHPDKFRLINWKAKGKMFWPDLRVTLDTKEDYTIITKIYEELYPKNPDFSAEDVVDLLLRHPEWLSINSKIRHRYLQHLVV